jgi:dTDP-4-dehydrorhamnose 3,5-epimerase
MKVTPTGFEGLMVIEPRTFKDERGYFFEAFNNKRFREHGIFVDFVQDNQSYSKKNVIRGLHFQKPPHAQTKLIRILSGCVLDVVLDLRKNQPTFGKTFSIELSTDSQLQLLVPRGFAHGFSALTPDVSMLYKCDDYYFPEFESGVHFEDPALAIDWKINQREALVSDHDRKLPFLSSLNFSF